MLGTVELRAMFFRGKWIVVAHLVTPLTKSRPHPPDRRRRHRPGEHSSASAAATRAAASQTPPPFEPLREAGFVAAAVLERAASGTLHPASRSMAVTGTSLARVSTLFDGH